MTRRISRAPSPGQATGERVLSSPAKLNTNLSSPGCATTATMEGFVSIVDNGMFFLGDPYETYT
ncbi:MAG TPA: hypothetical protein VKG38_17285 [Solirubrobacteraceae bacterium]|nr:hypothetical protein [Solirubrobacteraceae bacterium]